MDRNRKSRSEALFSITWHKRAIVHLTNTVLHDMDFFRCKAGTANMLAGAKFVGLGACSGFPNERLNARGPCGGDAS